MADLEQALEEQRELNEALQEAQGDLSAYEAELKARDIEVTKLKEELERLKHRSQVGGTQNQKQSVSPLHVSLLPPTERIQNLQLF